MSKQRRKDVEARVEAMSKRPNFDHLDNWPGT
jgi:hypothetical protein